jgi:hypothetical protein
MSTQGRKTFKAQLRIGDGESPEVFTKIDELLTVGPVGGRKTLINMSSHDTEGYEDFEVFDLKEGNELQAEAIDIVDNTSQGLVRTADDDSTKDNWQILDRNGKGYQFIGLVMGTETDYSDMRGKVVFRFTLKVCSKPTAVTVSL